MHEKRDRSNTVGFAESKLNVIAKTIEAHPDLEEHEIAGKVYEGLALIAKALRRAGFKKSRGSGRNSNSTRL